MGRKLQAKLRPDEQQPHTRRHRVGEGAKRPKARCHPERGDVDAAGVQRRLRVLPREACRPALGLPMRGRVGMGRQESAEAIVVRSHRGRRAEHDGPNQPSRSRTEAGADSRAEMPGPPRAVGDGIAENTSLARQTVPETDDPLGISIRREPPYTDPYVRWCGRRG